MDNDIDFINNIFSDFFNFCHFNPDSEKDNQEYYKGNLLTYEAEAWETSRLIVRLVKEYNSPYLAFIVLKADISFWGRNVKFCLDEIIENEHLKFLKIYKKIFFDKKCLEIENTFIKMLSNFASSDYLTEELQKLHNTKYRKTFPEEYAIYNREYPFEFSIAFSPRAYKKMFPGATPIKLDKDKY